MIRFRRQHMKYMGLVRRYESYDWWFVGQNNGRLVSRSGSSTVHFYVWIDRHRKKHVVWVHPATEQMQICLRSCMNNTYKDSPFYVCIRQTNMRAQIMERCANMHPEQLCAGTVLIGAGIGACYGGYHGYMESKHRPFRTNVEGTVVGLWMGTIYGGVAGLFWPITVPVVTSVSLSRWMWPTPPTPPPSTK